MESALAGSAQKSYRGTSNIFAEYQNGVDSCCCCHYDSIVCTDGYRFCYNTEG